MGNPATFGIKKDGQYKVTYVHNTGSFEKDLDYNILFHVCNVVHRFTDKQLTDMFDHIILEEDEMNMIKVSDRESKKFINEYDGFTAHIMDQLGIESEREFFEKALKNHRKSEESMNESDDDTIKQKFYNPSETQYHLIEAFSQASTKVATVEGKLIIPDYSFNLEDYDAYFVIDLDEECIDVLYEYIKVKLPFGIIRDSPLENIEEYIDSYGKAIGYLGQFGYNEKKHLKRYDSGKMTKKGQVTIPVEVRDALRMKEGDRLEFALSRHEIVSVQAKKKNSVGALLGVLNDKDEPL